MKFTVKLEPSKEEGYTVQCIELPAAISEGNTRKEAIENIKEAIKLVLEVTREQAAAVAEVTKVEIADA